MSRPHLSSTTGATYIDYMGRQRGGFGFVVLLVVMAIVLLLAAHVWTKISPRDPASNPVARPAAAENYIPLTTGASDAMAPAPANGPAATARARDAREQVNANGADIKKTLEQTP